MARWQMCGHAGDAVCDAVRALPCRGHARDGAAGHPDPRQVCIDASHLDLHPDKSVQPVDHHIHLPGPLSRRCMWSCLQCVASAT